MAPPDSSAEEVGVGSTLGSYKLQALIGKGGMGRVFKARHLQLGRTVAIKVLNAQHTRREDMVKRFFREAKVINDISHHNIVDVTDFVESGGHAYCVMEYLVGQSLGALLERKRALAVGDSAAIMRQVADALQAAHDHGVVHRDLKPDNIFLLKKRDSNGNFVKVLDFGVAKLIDGEGTAYTAEGMVVGTPAFMAPEQASGLEVDERTDIYAFGVVFYKLLAGVLPFRAATFGELLAKLTQQDPPPLPKATLRGEPIPQALAKAVMQCLEKKPSNRPQKMSELSALLSALQPKPIPRPGKQKKRRSVVAKAPRARRSSRSRSWRRWIAAVVLAAGAALLLVERQLVTREANRLRARASSAVDSAERTLEKYLPKGLPRRP